MAWECEYRPEYCAQIIEDANEGYSFEAFAGRVRVTKTTLYNWVKKYPEFALCKAIAAEVARRFWEGKGIQGLHLGKDFNATTWIFNMKNRCGWVDKVEQNINANLNVEKLTDNELRKLTEEAIKFLKEEKIDESEDQGLRSGN